MRIGVISDTHGVVHPGAAEALHGAEHILHAGDAGSRGILDRLARLAPVSAVRGNVDDWPGAEDLPETLELSLGEVPILMTHVGKPEDLWAAELSKRPPALRPRVVICGHTHAPRSVRRGGFLFLNPGSAGRRRFRLPLSVAILDIDDAGDGERCVTEELIILEPGSAAGSS